MDRRRLVPVVGIVACLAFLGVLAVPFGSRGAGLYYSSGVLNPLVGGLFAIVTIIVFAAGRQQRTAPELAAGVALAFGGIVAVTAIAWAATMRTDVIAIGQYHPLALGGAGIAIPVTALLYARELGLL